VLYEAVYVSAVESNAAPWAEAVAPPSGSEQVALLPDAGLPAPHPGRARPVRQVRPDFEQAARAFPYALLRQALADQLRQDGCGAFARRMARIFARAAPWLRNEIVAELLIGCGPCASTRWPSDGDCSVEALAELALAQTPGTTHQIAELCCRFPVLALALDHVDLADVLTRLARATGRS
jgi:hypothetical protein